MRKNRKCNRCNLSEVHLSGINLEDIANAMTDPNQRFEFPIKPFTYQMANSDKLLLGVGLGAIAIGLFANAYINATKK